MLKNTLVVVFALTLSVGSLFARAETYFCSGTDGEREQLFELKIAEKTAEQDYEQWKIGSSSKRYQATTSWPVFHNDEHSVVLAKEVGLYEAAPELTSYPSLALLVHVFVL